MMAAAFKLPPSKSLQSARDVLLANFDDVINDVELMALYEENHTRGMSLSWKYDKFDLNDWVEASCVYIR